MLTFIKPGLASDPCKLMVVVVPGTTSDMVESGTTAGLTMTLIVPVCVTPLHTQEYCIESTAGKVLAVVADAEYQNSAEVLVKKVGEIVMGV